MNVDDPRYTAGTYLADSAAGWGVDNFYTGASPITYPVDDHTPIGVDPRPYQIGGAVFSPYAPYLNTPGAGQGIVATAPTQVLQTRPTAQGSTPGAAQETSWLLLALLAGLLVLVVKR